MTENKKKKPAWLPVWGIIIASIVIAFEYGKVSPAAPSMIELLNLSYTMQGLLMTAFAVAAVIMGLVGGALIDKFGARPVVVVASLLAVVGNLLAMVWYTDAGLLITRVLEGFGYGAIMTAGPVIISAWYPPEKRGLAYGVWGANVGVGITITLMCANPIMAGHTWKAMWAFGLIGAGLALLLALFTVFMPAPEDRQDNFLDGGEEEADEEKHGLLWGYLAPMPLLGAIMFFLVGGSTDAFNAFTIPYLNVFQGEEFNYANNVATIASYGMMTGGIIMGFIFAKAKDKGMVIIVNVILCLVFLFAIYKINVSHGAMLAICFLGGCALGALPTCCFALAPMCARSQGTVGAATAVAVLGQNCGTLLIPTVIGAVLDATSYSMASTVMGILSVIALVVAFVFRAMYNKRYNSKDAVAVDKAA